MNYNIGLFDKKRIDIVFSPHFFMKSQNLDTSVFYPQMHLMRRGRNVVLSCRVLCIGPTLKSNKNTFETLGVIQMLRLKTFF